MTSFVVRAGIAAVMAIVGVGCSGGDGSPSLVDAGSHPDAPIATGSVDLSLRLRQSSDAVVVGATLTYVVDVSNLDAYDAERLEMTLQFDAGDPTFVSAVGTGWACAATPGAVTCTLARLASGLASELTIEMTAPESAGAIAATAAVASAMPDYDRSNNRASLDAVALGPTDLAIAVAAPDVAEGAGLQYTLAVTNQGDGLATGLTVVATLPAGVVFAGSKTEIEILYDWSCDVEARVVTCTRPQLAAGARVQLPLRTSPPTQLDALGVEAIVSAAVPDPVPGNNTASASARIVAMADLSIMQTATPRTVLLGGDVTYAVGVTNAGPNAAAGVSVVETLSDELSFVSATGPGWSCSSDHHVVTCMLAELGAASAAPPLAIVATATRPAVFDATATAQVSSSVLDPGVGRNSVTTFTTIDTHTELAIAITDDVDPVRVSTVADCEAMNCVTYTVAVTNRGPAAAVDVLASVLLPEDDNGVALGAFVDAVAPGWTCQLDGFDYDCQTGAIAAGETATIRVRWRAPTSVPAEPLMVQADVGSEFTPFIDAAEQTTVVP